MGHELMTTKDHLMFSIHRDLDRDDGSKSFTMAPSAEMMIYAYREFVCPRKRVWHLHLCTQPQMASCSPRVLDYYNGIDCIERRRTFPLTFNIKG
jgi:hypothetical protein